MLESTGLPDVLDEYAQGLKNQAARVRSILDALAGVSCQLGQIEDQSWQSSFSNWINRKTGELANIANHFDSAASVYQQLSYEVAQANSRLSYLTGGVQAANNAGLAVQQTNIFDSTYVVRSQAAARLQSLANEAPQVQTAKAVSSTSASFEGVLAVLGLVAAAALVFAGPEAWPVAGGDAAVSENTLAEGAEADSTAEQAAWQNYLARKAAEGADPLTRERWNVAYENVLRNLAVGTAYEGDVYDELSTEIDDPLETQYTNDEISPGRRLDFADVIGKIGYEVKAGNAINGGARILGELVKDQKYLDAGWSITWISQSAPTGAVLEMMTQMQLNYPRFNLIVTGT